MRTCCLMGTEGLFRKRKKFQSLAAQHLNTTELDAKVINRVKFFLLLFHHH